MAGMVCAIALGPMSLAAEEPVESEEAAIAALEAVGGRVAFDEEAPDRPVIIVELFRADIKDDGLKHLRAFTQLKKVFLGLTHVTDAGMEEFKHHPNLESLHLNSSLVTDRGLRYVAYLDKLRALSLNLPQATDQGIRRLFAEPPPHPEGKKPDEPPGLRNLESLGIGETPISDVVLKDLMSLPRLRWLSLHHTRITPEAIAAFRTARPTVRVVYEVFREAQPQRTPVQPEARDGDDR